MRERNVIVGLPGMWCSEWTTPGPGPITPELGGAERLRAAVSRDTVYPAGGGDRMPGAGDGPRVPVDQVRVKDDFRRGPRAMDARGVPPTAAGNALTTRVADGEGRKIHASLRA